jgi:lysophospholipase L1-like esterase
VWLAALLLIGSTACTTRNSSPGAPSPTPDPNAPIYYTAIGASDAAGVGSSIPCVPFAACPNGTGYVPTIARGLATGGRSVTLMNMGIPAAVLSPRIQALGAQYGRSIPANILDSEAPFVPTATTIITVFAGGNDANTIAAAVGGGAGGGDPTGFIDQQIGAFGDDFAALVRLVRQRAPAAQLVIANLPNFAGMPFTASFSVDDKRIMQRITVGLSTRVINAYVSQGIAVVDLMCDPRFLLPSIFSSDGFHPNDTGHAILASEMLKALTQPGYPSPQSSCAQMALIR